MSFWSDLEWLPNQLPLKDRADVCTVYISALILNDRLKVLERLFTSVLWGEARSTERFISGVMGYWKCRT